MRSINYPLTSLCLLFAKCFCNVAQYRCVVKDFAHVHQIQDDLFNCWSFVGEHTQNQLYIQEWSLNGNLHVAISTNGPFSRSCIRRKFYSKKILNSCYTVLCVRCLLFSFDFRFTTLSFAVCLLLVLLSVLLLVNVCGLLCSCGRWQCANNR